MTFLWKCQARCVWGFRSLLTTEKHHIYTDQEYMFYNIYTRFVCQIIYIVTVYIKLCYLCVYLVHPLLSSSFQFYLQSRFTWRGARLLRPLLQFTLLMMAFYTGLSRVSDHKHHPTDVLAGFVQGALVAYCIVSAKHTVHASCIKEIWNVRNIA